MSRMRTHNWGAVFLKRVLPAALLLAGVGGLLLVLLVGQPAQKTAITPRVWRVRTWPVRVGTYSPTLVLYGDTVVPQLTVLRAAVTAHVQAIRVKVGETVHQHQTLIDLDPQDMQHRYAGRQAAVAQLKAAQQRALSQHAAHQKALKEEMALLALQNRAVARQKTLLAKRHGSQHDWDKAQKTLKQYRLAVTQRQAALDLHPHTLADLQARLDQADSQLQQAALDLSRTRVRAPFAGRVVTLYAAQGDRVQPQHQLVALFPSDAMEIRAPIPTRYLHFFPAAVSEKRAELANNTAAKGPFFPGRAHLYATAYIDGQRLLFHLDRMSSTITPGEGSVPAYFRVISAHPPHRVLGRLVKLLLSLPPATQVVRIPRSALYDGHRVYIIQPTAGGKTQLRGITVETVGTAASGKAAAYVLIRSKSLHTGQRLVRTRLPQARTGLPVHVIN